MHSPIIGTLRDDVESPQTGRTACNFTQPGASILVVSLAVPADGSNLLQLLACLLLRYRIEVLQYPQTGRTSCNDTFLIPEVEPNKLAVPSDGSNLLQLLLSSAAMCSCASCSTLRRVEPLATTFNPIVACSSETLQ